LNQQKQQNMQNVSTEIFDRAKDLYRRGEKKEMAKKEKIERNKENPEKILDELSKV